MGGGRGRRWIAGRAGMRGRWARWCANSPAARYPPRPCTGHEAEAALRLGAFAASETRPFATTERALVDRLFLRRGATATARVDRLALRLLLPMVHEAG